MASSLGTIKDESVEVKFLGEIPHRDIAPFIANADLFVLPSRSEGFPISLLEAMACEVPVVSTMVGGVGTRLDDRYVTPIREPSAGAVAEALRYALQNPSVLRSRAEAARGLVEKNYSLDSMTQMYCDIYERLVN